MNHRALVMAVAAFVMFSATGCAGTPSEPGNGAAPASAPAEAGPPSPEATHRPDTASSVALLEDPAREWNVVLLGDSTGDDLDEFPFLAAQQLKDTYGRSVVVHRWAEGAGYSNDFIVEGSGAAPIHIWNGSVSGSVGQYAVDNLPAMAPAPADLVILNYGHNYAGASQAREGLTRLLEKVDGHLGFPPVLFVAQNPRNPETPLSRAIVEEVRAVAAEGDCGIVDVYRAFQDSGDVGRLLLDRLHPSPLGSRIWADTLVRQLS